MEQQDPISRRTIITGAAAGAAALAGLAHAADDEKPKKEKKVKANKGVQKGNIKQSVVAWCFNVPGVEWGLEKTCEQAKKLGCTSIELVGPDDWPTLKKHGLTCAIAPNGMPGAPFIKGLNNLKYHEDVIRSTKKMIDACSEHGIPNVIAFTGYKWIDAEDPSSGEISAEEGRANCIKGLKELAAYGEKKNVTICLEHLNTRDDTHPMKGHPGYQGDDVDEVADMLRAVGSERVKLLFDIYHVSVMNGDIIRRLDQLKDIIGHVHTAGNPGRGELNKNQEINFPACMKALLATGYTGYVGQEFIPVGDPEKALAAAVTLCDV